jgi:hypothetical protein
MRGDTAVMKSAGVFTNRMHAAPALAVVVLLAAAVVDGCGGERTKSPATASISESPTPSASSAPPFVGPVLVYSFETPMAQRQGNVDLTVAAFDAGTWHELHRTVLPSQRVMSPRLSAPGLLIYIFNPERAADPTELRSLDPVTGDIRTLYKSARGFEYSIAVSPDGSMVAFSEVDQQDDRSPADVRVLDIASGAARTIVTFTSQNPAGFVGRPTPETWRDDQRGFVVVGDAGTDAGGFATVMLDGTVVIHRERDAMYVALDGRAAATGGYGDQACALAAVGRTQQLQLWDFDANRVVNSIEDPGRGIRQLTWSPTGDELLYRQLSPLEAQTDCDRTGPEPIGRAFLLSVQGGPPVPVDDIAALRRQWYGDRIIDFECGDETAFNPFGECWAIGGRMFLNGREVVSGEGLRVLGFIERSP